MSLHMLRDTAFLVNYNCCVMKEFVIQFAVSWFFYVINLWFGTQQTCLGGKFIFNNFFCFLTECHNNFEMLPRAGAFNEGTKRIPTVKHVALWNSGCVCGSPLLKEDSSKADMSCIVNKDYMTNVVVLPELIEERSMLTL